MIKVTLLGDSIREIGYGKIVPELLGDGYEVYQPNENCRFSKYTLRGLYDWAEAMEGSDIVHWNNGHWDACDLFGVGTFSTEEEYIKNMLQIADILLERHQKVIFATTTPLRKEHKKSEKHNANVIRFNSIITPLLEEKGIIINDLHKLVSTDVEKYILPTDNIHLSEAGGEVCAKQVVDVIKTVEKTLCDDARKVKCETSQDKMGVPV